MKFINLSCLEQCRLCIEWHLNEVGELLNVCIVAPPYPPILLPTKAIGSCLKVVRLKRSQGNQEGDKYRESELSGWKGKGTKGVRRVEAGWLSLVSPSGSSRGFPWIWSAEGWFSRPWCSSASSDHLKVHFAYSCSSRDLDSITLRNDLPSN